MNFDFYKQYEHYSIQQLLQIVGNPELYQPAAVEAARALLSQRDAFSVAREQELLMPATLEEASAPGIFDDAEPGYDPRQVMLIRGLIILIFAYYLGSLIWRMFPFFYALGSIEVFYWLESMMLPVLTVIVYAVIPILIWRNVQLGWYSGMVISFYALITRAGALLYGTTLGAEPMTEGLIRVNALHVVLCGALSFLLWMPIMRDTFGISAGGKRWSMGVAAAVALALQFYQFFIV